jgi:hypothetical protein
MPKTERIISRPLDYRQYGEAIVMLFIEEPDEVSSHLEDLRNALAHTLNALAMGKGVDGELVGLTNSIICLHDALKAYVDYGLSAPIELKVMQDAFEGRRTELDLKG